MTSHHDEPFRLQETLANALRDLPSAIELRAFGSLAYGIHDEYSDVDLELITADSETSIAARHAIIERAAPIWIEWRIHPSHSGWAATILFTDLSPYRRLDLGITPIGSAASIDALNAQTVLWTQEPAPPIPKFGPSPVYAPAAGTPEHAMLEQLLSATRYVKARKRGQILTAYRFVSALATTIFATLEAERTGDIGSLWRKPSTSSFLALDRHLPANQRHDLLSLLDFSTPERMDAAVPELLRHNLALHDALPGVSAFPPDIAARLIAFIEDELHP
ncbi:MAG: nucleotidyltransferase domain-containing protein [Thermomicrobiales bacterium]